MTDAPVRVLLVEDDEDDAVLTRGLLREIEGRKFELEWVKAVRDFVTALGQGTSKAPGGVHVSFGGSDWD